MICYHICTFFGTRVSQLLYTYMSFLLTHTWLYYLHVNQVLSQCRMFGIRSKNIWQLTPTPSVSSNWKLLPYQPVSSNWKLLVHRPRDHRKIDHLENLGRAGWAFDIYL